MSRYHPEWNIEPVFEAATHWRDMALIGQKSVFGDSGIWSDENVESMNRHYVQNLDEGEGNFMQKFERQLENAPADTKKLAAEMMWFMLLCSSNIGAKNKRETVFAIWDWSGDDRPPLEPWLTDDVLHGIGSTGTAFNTHRWREVVFFVRFLQKFRAEDSNRQQALLKDPWDFARWFEAVPDAEHRQLRHMILYLLFPDDFERIFGRSNRLKLIRSFTGRTRAEAVGMSAIEVNQEIQRIRRDAEETHPGQTLDFYTEPLRDVWRSGQPVEPEPAQPDAFEEYTSSVRRQHVHAALAEIDRDGIPGTARSTTYDLVYGEGRYPPKYVLSLACRHASGEEFPRQFFHGGRESRAFKLLESLGFHIELKGFLSELISKFVQQADEGVSQAVSEYPKDYRGLSVNVSFGMGSFAHIPWVSFTGYEQTTQRGIYPVVLYYKSTGNLVVAYGVSERNPPEQEWQGVGEYQTVTDYMRETVDEGAERYGTSYVAEAFDLSETVNYAAIEQSIDKVIGQFHSQFQLEAEPEDDIGLPPQYGVAEALDGLFIEEEKLEELLSLLRTKKNVILQGPPGVGKTFVSRRLAYALMGEEAKDRLGMVQFHQSYAYEDFVQGYRPSGTGFTLKNGVFFEFCDKAKKDPAGTYVFIIDEINRGNLSKVFGEIMMLIESDKRGPDWEIPLTYSDETKPKFYIPENLYLIGLMNTADRSLAMVDYALRRRFAFADLEPGFDTDEFRQFMQDGGAIAEFIEELISRMDELNAKIAGDSTNLGRGYCVGHSFFCVLPDGEAPDWDWYRQIIRTEISPLLREYYFDDEKTAVALINGLLRNP